MVESVYTCQVPDYFPFIFTRDAWENVLDTLENIPEDRVLCLDGNTLSTAGKAYICWQKVKAFFGFQNLTDETKVGAFLARFVFQGVVQGYFHKNEQRIRSLQTKIFTNKLKVHEDVKGFFNFAVISGLQEVQLQGKLITYFTAHRERTAPSFWNCLLSERMELPPRARFGDTHLRLGKDSDAVGHRGEALEHYRIAAQLCNLEDLEYTENLIKLIDSNNIMTSDGSICCATKIGQIELLLAERMFSKNAFPASYELFKRALKNNVTFTDFTMRQKVFYLHASLQTGHYDEAVGHTNCIDLTRETEALKKLYAETMRDLGEHFASKIGTKRTHLYRLATFGYTPSSADHATKAATFYKQGLSVSEQVPSLLHLHQILLHKLFRIAPHLLSPLLRVSSPLNANEQLTQIYAYLASMQSLHPLDTSEGLAQHYLESITSLILAFYLQNGLDLCREPIEQALQIRGDIKAKFQIKKSKADKSSVTWLLPYRSSSASLPTPPWLRPVVLASSEEESIAIEQIELKDITEEMFRPYWVALLEVRKASPPIAIMLYPPFSERRPFFCRGCGGDSPLLESRNP